MKNFILTSAVCGFIFLSASNSYAESNTWTDHPSALVIIDTGINSSQPEFQGKIIEEVCTLDWWACPNQKRFQIGQGASALASDALQIESFWHGSQMASIALAANPNMKIIFIKIVGSSGFGTRLAVTEESVQNALSWVFENRLTYNIKAIAMSQGHHRLSASTNYCPNTPRTEELIKKLKNVRVPIFFPSGNIGDSSRIDWPACIPDAIAVGATNQRNEIASYSNNDQRLVDLYAPGSADAVLPSGAIRKVTGTSVSTQIAAAKWVEFISMYGDADNQLVLALMKGTGNFVEGGYRGFGRQINMERLHTLMQSVLTGSF